MGNLLLKYTDFIFLIVRMVVMDVFFAKKSTYQGLYNCKLKNEMTVILEFFSAKKKIQSWQDGPSHLLYSLLA